MTVATAWLIALVELMVPPGNTAFSVHPAEDCRGADVCEGGKWSTFYQTWVRQETADEGRERYRTVILPALESTIEKLLCMRLDQSRVEGCTVDPDALDRKTKKQAMGPLTAASAMLGVIVNESGLREDVQVGRGFAKACPKGSPEAIAGVCGPSDDGGRGRGPANECGLGQHHPQYAWMVASIPEELRIRARAGDKAARGEVCQTLMGTDRASVERSMEATLRQLLRSKQHCSWALRQSKIPVAWDYAMFSLYGINSCTSSNHGKTEKRVGTFRSLLFQMKRASKAS